MEELIVLVRGEAEVGHRVRAGDGRVEGCHVGHGVPAAGVVGERAPLPAGG